MKIETYLETLVQVPGRNDFSTKELNRQLDIVKECVLASTDLASSDYPYRIGRCWANGGHDYVDFRFDIVSDEIRSEDVFRLDISVNAVDPKWYIHLFVENKNGNETLPGVEMEFNTSDGSFHSLAECLSEFQAKYDAKVGEIAQGIQEKYFSDKQEAIKQIGDYLKVATDLARANGFRLALDTSIASVCVCLVPASATIRELGTPGEIGRESLPEIDLDCLKFNSDYDSFCIDKE